MTEKTYKLTAPLWDERDPNRPKVFIAAEGEEIPYRTAVKYGLVKGEPALKKVETAEVENKAVKPAEAKAPRKSKA